MFYFKLAIFLLFVSCGITKVDGAQLYEIEDVTTLGGSYYPSCVVKINNNGNIVFSDFNENQILKVFFYEYATKNIFELDSLNEKYHTYLLDINDDNVIFGYTDIDEFDSKEGRKRQTRVIKWKNFIAEDMAPILGNVYAKSNQFLSINNAEVISGFGFALCNQIDKKYGNQASIIIPRSLKKKQIRSILHKNYHTRLVSLNEKGDAAGGFMYGDDAFFGIGHGMASGPKSLACFWNAKSKKIISIGNLTNEKDKYSFATNLNDHLQVIGGSEVSLQDSRGQYFWHAFVWNKGNFLDLGTLESNEDSVAFAINNSGEVIGVSGGVMGHATHENKASKSFYWSKEKGMQNLNSMTEEGSGWNIVWVKDINNLGQIIAYGIKNNEVHLVILNPIK